MHITRQIIISKEDLERLERLFASDIRCDSSERPNLQSLRNELDNATIVDPDDIPPDVVTLCWESSVNFMAGGPACAPT